MFRASRAAFAKTLVLAQAGPKGVSPATLSAITAATKIGGEVDAFVAGSAAGEAVSKIAGLNKVLVAESPALEHELSENISATLATVAKAGGYSHVVAPSSALGKSVAPRIGALLDSQPLSDISAVVSEDTFERSTYAGNVVTKVKVSGDVKVLSVRAASFDKAAEGGSASVESVSDVTDTGLTQWVSDATTSSDKPDLQSAEVVVSGGRGMKDPANWHIVEGLAGKLNAAVGATRAVVDAGWVPSELQVGQTGKIVAPSLYIACGISGAIQHVTGMKDSKTIVAINTDPDAPIMSLADYGLVGDALKAVPEMTEKL
eukprot:TRINITY_DN2526_c0_g4_i1.p2 TRINITY_DN2526_c0_g4~~TRINITY_DN2526_c0_g4_i1.p2  ORF type:complete len:317 (+),score=157.42 TRINITY_DN2526_c0_g4_i1:63-1013(+)